MTSEKIRKQRTLKERVRKMEVKTELHKHCSRCGWPIFSNQDKSFAVGVCAICRKAIRDLEDGNSAALEY